MLIDVHQSDDMGNIFTLRENLTVEGITVPAGFSSDGASVPRFFWRLVFPPGDQKALRAAFVHDWLYRTHPLGWTRESADMLFLKILLKDNMPKYRAVLAWLGVRLFGRGAWSANNRLDRPDRPDRQGAEGEVTGRVTGEARTGTDGYGWVRIDTESAEDMPRRTAGGRKGEWHE